MLKIYFHRVQFTLHIKDLFDAKQFLKIAHLRGTVQKKKSFEANQNDQPNTGEIAKMRRERRTFAQQQNLRANFFVVSYEALN